MTQRKGTSTSRRAFLRASSAAVVGGAVAGSLQVLPNVHVGGSELIRVGLIGCGGRGTGAAAQALSADKEAKLVAMGDAFADRIEQSLTTLRKDQQLETRIDVAP